MGQLAEQVLPSAFTLCAAHTVVVRQGPDPEPIQIRRQSILVLGQLFHRQHVRKPGQSRDSDIVWMPKASDISPKACI